MSATRRPSLACLLYMVAKAVARNEAQTRDERRNPFVMEQAPAEYKATEGLVDDQ